MPHTDFIDESISYSIIIGLYRSFISSVFFRIFERAIGYVQGVLKKAFLNSETLHFFQSSRKACTDYAGRLIKTKRLKEYLSLLASIYLSSLTCRLFCKTI